MKLTRISGHLVMYRECSDALLNAKHNNSLKMTIYVIRNCSCSILNIPANYLMNYDVTSQLLNLSIPFVKSDVTQTYSILTTLHRFLQSLSGVLSIVLLKTLNTHTQNNLFCQFMLAEIL